MRPSWDQYFMSIASTAAARSTCDRAHVGAVLVDTDRQIISTGYNGSLRGLPSCDEIGHTIIDGHCVATLHAEENAIIQAARRGVSTKHATLYCTHLPCLKCTKDLLAAGISNVLYKESYKSDSEESKLAAYYLGHSGVLATQFIEV